MELIVIHNPDAGDGYWSAKRVKRLLSEAGHSAHITSRKKKWRDCMAERPDAFVAAGGDGTVHKVAHELAGGAVPLAILPTGTANNVAHAMGYRAGDDLAAVIARWPQSEKQLNISLIEADGERRRFIESVGVGAFVDMRRATGADEKRAPHAALGLLKMRHAMIASLLEATPVSVTIQIDDTVTTEDYVLLECLNLPYYGPRLHVVPGAADTADVTVCGVRASERERAAHWIAASSGRVPADWLIGRGTSVRLWSEGSAHVDGELWQQKHMQITAGVSTVRIWA